MLLNALGFSLYNQFGFQTAATPFMEGIIDLHHNLFFFMILIFIFVFWVIINCIFYFVTSEKLILLYEKHFYKNLFSGIVSNNSYYSFESPLVSTLIINFFNIKNGFLKNIISKLFNFDSDVASWAKFKSRSQSLRFNHGTIIEFVWTIAPCFILAIIAIQSFNLLYSAEDVTNAYICIKVIGHQWYWTYEYTYAYDKISSADIDPFLFFDLTFLEDDFLAYADSYVIEKTIELLLTILADCKYQLSYDDRYIIIGDIFEYYDFLAQKVFVMHTLIDSNIDILDQLPMLVHAFLDEEDQAAYSVAIIDFLVGSHFFEHFLDDCMSLDSYCQYIDLMSDIMLEDNEFVSDLAELAGVGHADAYILKHVNITSYMVPTDELNVGDLRLLECDKVLYIPAHVHINFYVTAVDVIHSWAIPSLGIKMDAIPGRLNMVSTYIARTGVYYGQCSEICGINHGFMPIVLIAYEK